MDGQTTNLRQKTLSDLTSMPEDGEKQEGISRTEI